MHGALQRMKSILTLLFFMGGMTIIGARPAAAQNKSNKTSVKLSVKIIGSIKMIMVKTIQLSEADAKNNHIHINPKASGYAGKMIAVGISDSDIRVHFVKKQKLTNQDKTGKITFTAKVAGNDENDPSTAEFLKNENRTYKLNSDGRFYLWIGGDANISGAAPGDYHGDFKIRIEYI
jgi:hypothetical protein